jgi:hypothetical protein
MTARLTLICHASTDAVRKAAFPADEPIDGHDETEAAELAKCRAPTNAGQLQNCGRARCDRTFAGEIERRYQLFGKPGAIKITGFVNNGRAASFAECWRSCRSPARFSATPTPRSLRRAAIKAARASASVCNSRLPTT